MPTGQRVGTNGRLHIGPIRPQCLLVDAGRDDPWLGLESVIGESNVGDIDIARAVNGQAVRIAESLPIVPGFGFFITWGERTHKRWVRSANPHRYRGRSPGHHEDIPASIRRNGLGRLEYKTVTVASWDSERPEARADAPEIYAWYHAAGVGEHNRAVSVPRGLG